jgi:hypothetical protein
MGPEALEPLLREQIDVDLRLQQTSAFWAASLSEIELPAKSGEGACLNSQRVGLIIEGEAA